MLSSGVQSINLFDCRIYFGEGVLDHLRPILENSNKKGSRCFLLTDETTHQKCLPVLEKYHQGFISEFVIPPGERSKSLDNAERMWDWLKENGAHRSDVLINLGGGVVTDLGGFVASTFHRGIRYINIPTTLLAQADAAIGGKTGVNLSGSKNQLGTFYQPEAIFICPDFLKTLPEEQVRSGFAEIIKCSLLAGEKKWSKVARKPLKDINDWAPLLKIAIKYKAKLIKKDPKDFGIRQALNFGHTLGHALESHSMQKYPPGLLHGDAIALGMIGELFISYRKGGICWEKLLEIHRYLKHNFTLNPFAPEDAEDILKYILSDKKNIDKEFKFSLLDDFGKPMVHKTCEPEIIQKAIIFITREN